MTSRAKIERTSSFDVCIVGSGAGGAVVAKELAESGLSVCVLEEGAHYTPEEYGRFTVAESSRRMLRNGGATFAYGVGDSPSVQIVTGRAVGGGSVLTGGVCFRTPDHVLESWRRDGLTAFAPDRMAPLFDHVEREVHVEHTPEALRSGSTQLFVEGAKRLGITMSSMRRNTRGCEGKGRCTIGCPNQAKQSVDITYLAKARRHGAVLHSDCLALRVLIQGGRAVGVEGRRLVRDGSSRAGSRFTVHARMVVVAAGALHTPLLLRASGIGKRSNAVGKNLALHPSFGVGAIAPMRIDGWRGALQSVYSDHFASSGITLLSVFAATNVMASRMPGAGDRHLDLARSIPRTALFGGLVHDTGRGVVRRGIGREPLITYRMSARDKELFARAFLVVAEMAFEGGATAVMLPVEGLAPVRSPDELRAAVRQPLAASRFQAISFHPLGTARMGVDPARDVVDENGESHEVTNLFVADGSTFRSPVGVNAQIPIMANATHIAWRMRELWSMRHQGQHVMRAAC